MAEQDRQVIVGEYSIGDAQVQPLDDDRDISRRWCERVQGKIPADIYRDALAGINSFTEDCIQSARVSKSWS